MRAIEKVVAGIIEEVNRGGDRALARCTMNYDRVRVPPDGMEATDGEIAAAVSATGRDFASLMRRVARNIAAYHRPQLPRNATFKNLHGARVGWRYVPVGRVGVYLPAGRAPLVSTALMTIVPARVAGVGEIIVATPPRRDGSLNPFMLAACRILGADRIFRVGGAQAVAAMALGTERIPRVDLIVGPGNAYVTEAKRQLYGKVGIDMTAGPSEVAIVADGSADAAIIASDLLAQAEHDPMSLAVLFTTSLALLRAVKRQLAAQSAGSKKSVGTVKLVKCGSLADAVAEVNRMAPEHLELMTESPDALVPRIRNAGAIFAGRFSATALGDYVAGPSHVLPTAGSARFSSVLSVDTFFKRISYVKYDRKSAMKAVPQAERLAALEGLQAHARALRARLDTTEAS